MNEPINQISFKKEFTSQLNHPGSLLLYLLIILSAVFTISILFLIIGYILYKGIPNINLKMFEWNYNKENLSMLPTIINTLILTFLSLLFSVPVGVGSALYLVEYQKRSNKFVRLIQLTTQTLAGIPSIIYGLFGFLLFVVGLSWGYSLLGGALTLSIMVLPVIMNTTEESLKSVPDLYREGSYGLGVGKIRTIFHVVLPAALPGIVNGIILATGRVVGETAALIYTSGTVARVPSSIMGSGRSLAVQMYTLLSEGLYMDQAYACGVVLIVMVVLLNFTSSLLTKNESRN